MSVPYVAAQSPSAPPSRPVETREEAIRAVRRVAPSLPIVSAALCGSFARGEQTSKSDIDLMVCFSPGARLSDVEEAREAFERETGRGIDIITNLADQTSAFRHSVLRGAVRVYG